MSRLLNLERYKDEKGNEVVYDGDLEPKTDIRFQKGSNNRVVIDSRADLRHLLIIFTGNNGLVEIGPTTAKRAGLNFNMRVGYDSTIRVEENVGCAGNVFVSATEGQTVRIGRDTMFAKNIEVRTDDTHGIYDVRTGARANPARSIDIGEHVWLAKHVVVMGGTTIGNGSVIGFRSIASGTFPNNVVAVGVPARVVRRDVAWERPETPNRPPDETWPLPGAKSTKYWNVTDDRGLPQPSPSSSGPRPAVQPVRSRTAALRTNAARVRSRLRRELAKRRRA